MNKGTAIVFVLVAFVGGYYIGNVTSRDSKGKSASESAVQSVHASKSIDAQEKELGPGNAQSDRTRVLIGPDDPVWGEPDAPVTIVEWSDFQCPYCKKAADTVSQIKKNYGKQVRIVFKQNPLQFHKDAMPAAEAALAAREQGKFWEYHDLLFSQQKLDRASLDAYAKQVGLDMAKFKAAVDGHKFKAAIEADQAYGARVGARGTPTFFINGKVVRGAQPYEQFKSLIDAEIQYAKNFTKEKKIGSGAFYAELMRGARPGMAAPPRPAAPVGVADPSKTYKVPVGDSPVKGSPTAKVTVIIFSDFQCPYCSRVEPTLSSLEEKYGKDLRLVWKNNPLPMHPQAGPAAEAAMAAGEQGKFWPYHDKLFANQRSLDAASLEQYAKDVGLDVARWKATFTSGRMKAQVQADMELASQFGVRGTPSFFINGRPLRGAQPIDAFTKLVDEELAQANQILARGVAPARLYDEIIKDGETKVSAPPRPTAPQGPDPASVYKLEVEDGDPTLGPRTAKVTIVEFSDFQCPFCSKAAPVLEELQKKYPRDVRLVFRNLPLPMHSNAQIAAEAAMAAHDQGKFWQMHDRMFANQQKLDRASLEGYATEIGLNLAKFKAALDGGKFKDAVSKHMQSSRQFGVRGTPTVYINGRYWAGPLQAEALEGRVKEEITKAEELLKKGTRARDLYATIIKDGKTSVGGPMPGAPAVDTTVYKVDPGNSPSLGSPRAPVTMVVFSDFQCPYCGRAAPTVHALAEAYPRDLRIVFKNLPLPMHPNANIAAQAAMAANEQGKFWQMHDKMFANQQRLDRASLDGFAAEIGLDVARFKAALDSGKYKAAVEADAKVAGSVGINGTPTFLINGRKVAGALPVDSFKKIVDEELAKTKAAPKGPRLPQAGVAPRPRAPQ